MITNILEYITTDVYYRLWMVAMQEHTGNPHKRFFMREDWNPDLLTQFSDTSDIPDYIFVKEESEHHLNGDHQFHLGRNKPSLKITEMVIKWGNFGDKITDSKLDRKIGPAKVFITDLKKYHNNGDLHRKRGDALICKNATFTWAHQGTYKRSNGPYYVNIHKITANAKHGHIYDFSMERFVPSWATDSGRRLSQFQVKDVLITNGLTVNLLANDSIFINDEDEFIFLTEIAE